MAASCRCFTGSRICLGAQITPNPCPSFHIFGVFGHLQGFRSRTSGMWTTRLEVCQNCHPFIRLKCFLSLYDERPIGGAYHGKPPPHSQGGVFCLVLRVGEGGIVVEGSNMDFLTSLGEVKWICSSKHPLDMSIGI